MTQANSLPRASAPSDPTMKDLLDLHEKQVLLNTFCHHIGTIQSFDSDKQVATATVNYKKTYFALNKSTGQYDPTLVDYPLMVDCPVICLGGGDGSLTFPIEQGDECLILFNDRDIDNWFKGSSTSGVATPRYHSSSDGIIIVGVRSLANVLEDYDEDRVVLQYGTTQVALGESQIKLSNQSNGTLGQAMTELLTALTTFMSACEGSPDPVLAAAAAAFSSSAEAAIENIEGLLE